MRRHLGPHRVGAVFGVRPLADRPLGFAALSVSVRAISRGVAELPLRLPAAGHLVCPRFPPGLRGPGAAALPLLRCPRQAVHPAVGGGGQRSVGGHRKQCVDRMDE